MPNITLNLEENIRNRLKEESNQSRLVNQLLREHYEVDRLKKKTVHELQKEMAIEQLRIDFETKVKEIENGAF